MRGAALENFYFVKTAASLKTLQHAVSKHKGKFLDLSGQMNKIDSSLDALKRRMNQIVTSAGGKMTNQNKAEWRELSKMRKKLTRFKMPYMHDFSPKSMSDFHGGAWKNWVAAKGRGMTPETRSVLQEGATTFGRTVLQGIKQTKGGKALTAAPHWDEVVNISGNLRKLSPSSREGKSFMSTNATLHELDELAAGKAVDAWKRTGKRRGRALAPSKINSNSHIGLDPILNDMNRANTATGAGSFEFRSAVKKQRWDELDFLEKVLPAESARHITTLKRGGRISRHAKRKLNRDWVTYARRHGSEHSHESAFTRHHK